jgi:hypothetical protein
MGFLFDASGNLSNQVATVMSLAGDGPVTFSSSNAREDFRSGEDHAQWHISRHFEMCQVIHFG